MTACNVVKFRVKPGREQHFLDAHRDGKSNWQGLQRAVIIATGERSYTLVGEWDSAQALGEARGRMIATLDGFRDMLEELGPGLGVTDAASGEVVLKLPA